MCCSLGGVISLRPLFIQVVLLGWACVVVSLWNLAFNGNGMGGWMGAPLWGISSPSAFETDERNRSRTPLWVCYPGLFVRKWSLCPDLTFEVPRLLWLLFFMSLCFLFLFSLFCLLSLTRCPLMLLHVVTHLMALNSLPICHFLSCKALYLFVCYLSFLMVELKYFHNIFFLFSSHHISSFSISWLITFLLWKLLVHPFQLYSISFFIFIF